jgi:hypothetical protein
MRYCEIYCEIMWVERGLTSENVIWHPACQGLMRLNSIRSPRKRPEFQENVRETVEKLILNIEMSWTLLYFICISWRCLGRHVRLCPKSLFPMSSYLCSSHSSKSLHIVGTKLQYRYVFPTLFASCLDRYRKARGKWSWPQPCRRRVQNEIFLTQFQLVAHAFTIFCEAQAALRDLLDASEADKSHAGLAVHERDFETGMRSHTRLDMIYRDSFFSVPMNLSRSKGSSRWLDSLFELQCLPDGYMDVNGSGNEVLHQVYVLVVR